MTLPNIVIECEAVIKKGFLRAPKPCRKPATFCVVLKHCGDDCESISYMFCTEHKQQVEPDIMTRLLPVVLAQDMDGFMRCMACHKTIIQEDELATITEI